MFNKYYKMSDVKNKFESAYEAGFDAGLNGPNVFNSHFRWFNTKERMEEWERGKRNAEIKEGLIDPESDRPKKRGAQRSPFGIGS